MILRQMRRKNWLNNERKKYDEINTKMCFVFCSLEININLT